MEPKACYIFITLHLRIITLNKKITYEFNYCPVIRVKFVRMDIVIRDKPFYAVIPICNMKTKCR